ncbi:InlB B-repeat-containing protein [Tissierella praeacuta]|uniref:InlB B-repeat-containing protein n=1 Tax=Tissierella praeacuta TaxID=43131 RepID=UPI003DA54DA0
MKNFIKRVLIFALVFINMMNINAVFAETEKINLTIRAVVNDKKIDELINAGRVVEKNGEEVLEHIVEVELGTVIKIRAVNGNKSFFKGWKRPNNINEEEFKQLFGASHETRELTFEVTEEFKTRKIKTIEASYNHFIEIDPSGTDFEKGTVDIEVTGKGANLYSKKGHPLGQRDDKVKFKANAKVGYEFEKWEFIWAMPIIGSGAASNKDVEETDAEIEIILPAIPRVGKFQQNYLPVIAHFKESEKQDYKVDFNTNGGSAIAEQQKKEGEKATKPTDPIKEGYKFIGWYEDSNLTKEFDFDTPITKDITLYAKWRENNETLNPKDYITNIRIPKFNDPESNEHFFHKYEIQNNKMLLFIGKDSPSWKNPTYHRFEGFTDPTSGGGGLMNYEFAIETTNIKEIKVDNNAKDEITEDIKKIAIKGFKADADEWRKGISFNDFGSKTIYTDGSPGFNRSRFDKDNPPVFTFITNDGHEFQLTWEAIKVEAEVEERIELKVKPNAGELKNDPEVKAGIVKGEELINYKELERGERVRIKAEDGNKSFFDKWELRRQNDYTGDKLKTLLGQDITKKEIEFEIGDYAFELAKNYEIYIEASYKTYTIIDTTQTSSEEGNVDILVFDTKGNKRTDFNSKNGFPLADTKHIIEFRAIPKDGYTFHHWEFITPGVVGPNTKNPNVDLNSHVIQIELPFMVTGSNPENNYNLRLKGVFSKKTKNIEEIIDIKDEEFIQGYDKYQLPSTVKVKYDDGSEGFEIISWDRSIETAQLGENIFLGTVAGIDKKTEIKVIMKKIMAIKEEYKIQEETVYNGDSFGEYRSYKLPQTAGVVLNDNTERTINIEKWEGENVVGSDIRYYKHGTYEAKGTVKGFDEKLIFKLNVKREQEKEKLKVEFDSNGGSLISKQEVEEGQKLIKPTDPTKEGHKFIGWYEDSNLTKEFSFATPITKDIILYAKWEEEPLQEILEIKSVELIKDGKIISKGIIKDKTITLELPEGFDESIIEGKHILKITGTEGTNISQDRGYDGSIEEWATGKVTNSIMPGQSAKFTIYKDDNSVEYIIEIVESTVKKYRVTFNTNGGNNISSIEVEEGQKLTKPTDPIKKDHKFIGWYEDSSLTKEFNFDTEITKDLTLYAKWEEEPTKEYTVNFNTNGGSSINSKKVKEGEKLSRPSDPTKVNYRFMGWYEDSNLTKVFNFDTPITKEITLYVKWEKVEKPEPEKPVEKKDAKILSFKLLGIEGSINHSTGKIYVDLPYRTSLKDLIPVITYSEGATISPDIGMAKDFERTVRYTLSGENFNSKTYEVDVSMPREKEYEEIINRDSNWYRDRHRDSRRSRRDEKDWYEITQEIKKERLREEERKTRAEIRREALDEVSKITAQSENIRRDLSFTQFSDYMDIRLNTIGMNDLYKNKINIPAGVLKNLKELEFDYLKYSTGLLGIKIYPSMDSPDGVYINIKPAPNEPYNNVQAQWSKIKGAGRIFEIETNSTKAGLSIEMRLEKLLPAEYIRVVKYNYMKRQFEDLAPEKWSIIDGYIHMQQVSGGIYGVIYKR